MKRSPHSRKAPKEESIEETVAAYDSAARDAAWRWNQNVFDHSEESVERLEGILDEIARHLSEPSLKRRIGLGPSETDVEQWANLWGIYLGETLRARLGGAWITGHEEAPSLLAVDFGEGTIAFPTARVYRRLTEGSGENVVDYYRSIVASVTAVPPSPTSTDRPAPASGPA
jgi:hypothetical protein